jgi:hypothetical protein
MPRKLVARTFRPCSSNGALSIKCLLLVGSICHEKAEGQPSWPDLHATLDLLEDTKARSRGLARGIAATNNPGAEILAGYRRAGDGRRQGSGQSLARVGPALRATARRRACGRRVGEPTGGLTRASGPSN